LHEFGCPREVDSLADDMGWEREALRTLILAGFAACAGPDAHEVVGWPDWSVKVTDRGLIRVGGRSNLLVTVVISPRNDGLPGLVASRLGQRIHYVYPTRRVSRTMSEAVALMRNLISAVGPDGRLPGDREIRLKLRLSPRLLNASRSALMDEGLLVMGASGWWCAPTSGRKGGRP
jgi:hypothetical protein